MRYCTLKCKWVSHGYCDTCEKYTYTDARGNVDAAQKRLNAIMGELEKST